MVAIAGLRGIGDAVTDERPKNFRETIAFREPSAGRAPITALMSRVKSESVDDFEFHWWDEPVNIVRLKVSGSHAAGDTLITIDSVDPTTSTPSVNWGVARHLKPGNILQCEKAAQATYDNELILVEQVVSDTQFVGRRGFAGTTAVTQADDVMMTVIGSAYPEGGGPPRATNSAPMKYVNYLQETKTTYEITKEAAATKFRTGDARKNARKRGMTQHSMALEQQLMWGVKSTGTDPVTGKLLYTSDGFRKLIPASRTTIFSGNVTGLTLLNAVYPVFDWVSDAGDERIGFCGNSALNALNVMVQYERGVNINMNETVKIFGLDFRKFVMPQGTLYLRTHPLLNLHPLYTKDMFIIDFSAAKWRYLTGFDTDFEDDIQLKGEMQFKGQWVTVGGLELMYGGLTSAYLGNIAYTPA